MAIERMKDDLKIYFNREFQRVEGRYNNIIDNILLKQELSEKDARFILHFLSELYIFLLKNNTTGYRKEVHSFVSSVNNIILKIVTSPNSCPQYIRDILSTNELIQSTVNRLFKIRTLEKFNQLTKRVIEMEKLDGSADIEFHRGFENLLKEEVENK